MKIHFYIGVISLLVLINLSSCKKLDYDNGFKTFAEVFFINQNTTDLGVKINNTPVSWQNGTGQIRVPEGETTFVFYDKQSGKELGEKTVNVISGNPETFLVFQPLEGAPVAFLDPRGQAEEPAAPEGYMKVKIANYAGDLLPPDLDIIVLGLNMNMETVELATLESVTNNLGEEQYRQIPTGGSDILAYTFKFRNRNTQEIVKNHGDEDYWNQNVFLYPDSMFPFPEKRVFTIYLRTYEQWGEYPAYIKSGDKFYEVSPEILYAD